MIRLISALILTLSFAASTNATDYHRNPPYLWFRFKSGKTVIIPLPYYGPTVIVKVPPPPDHWDRMKMDYVRRHYGYTPPPTTTRSVAPRRHTSTNNSTYVGPPVLIENPYYKRE